MTKKIVIFTQKDYLEHDTVKEFCKYLQESIVKLSYENHTYCNRKTKEKFECTSLQEAATHYQWNGKNLRQTVEEMQFYRNKLVSKESGDITKDEIQLLETFLDLMDWGGVTGFSHDIAKRFVTKKLCNTINEAKRLLDLPVESPLDNKWRQSWGVSFENIPMNSGYTKIYATCFEQHVIYDSRVAMALAGFVRAWGRECADRNEVKSAGDLLAFRIPKPQGKTESRKPPRQQGSCPINFPWIHGTPEEKARQHAEWNVRANWIIGHVLTNYSVVIDNENCVRFVHEEGSDGRLDLNALRDKKWNRARAIEMAFFMIGYNIDSAIGIRC